MTKLSVSDDRRHCLIVDDDPGVRAALARVMDVQGFSCITATCGTEALEILDRQGSSEEDGTHVSIPLVLTDYHMPGMDGEQLLGAIMTRWPDTAVVMITCELNIDNAVKCLGLGALDYITKPFGVDEVRARVSQALEKRRLLIENRLYRDRLEERVAQQAHKYEELFLASLQSLADALEVKDAYTWGHSTRVSRVSVAIARDMGISGSLLDQIELGGRLHDIGKIGVREAVLNKIGALSDDEYAHVMEHPVIGWRLLAPLMREVPHALDIVRSHHERFDGFGTPDKLVGLEIPVGARIVAVADSFDAMTSGRVYRYGVSFDDAMAELRRCAGTQFDPTIVAAHERVMANDLTLRPATITIRHSRKMRVVG